MENYINPSFLNVANGNKYFKEALKDIYPMTRKRNCDCGYDPELESDKGSRKSKEEKCPVTLALSNHVTFPSLKMLPISDKSKELYLQSSVKKHWY